MIPIGYHAVMPSYEANVAVLEKPQRPKYCGVHYTADMPPDSAFPRPPPLPESFPYPLYHMPWRPRIRLGRSVEISPPKPISSRLFVSTTAPFTAANRR